MEKEACDGAPVDLKNQPCHPPREGGQAAGRTKGISHESPSSSPFWELLGLLVVEGGPLPLVLKEG